MGVTRRTEAEVTPYVFEANADPAMRWRWILKDWSDGAGKSRACLVTCNYVGLKERCLVSFFNQQGNAQN